MEGLMAVSNIKIRCDWCDRVLARPDIPCSLANGPALKMLVMHPGGNATCKHQIKARGI
jgi:hypothetical protein